MPNCHHCLQNATKGMIFIIHIALDTAPQRVEFRCLGPSFLTTGAPTAWLFLRPCSWNGRKFRLSRSVVPEATRCTISAREAGLGVLAAQASGSPSAGGRAEGPWPPPRGRCRNSAAGALSAPVPVCAGASGKGAGPESPTPGCGAGGGGGRVGTVP